MKQDKLFEGIFPAVITPFGKDGGIDEQRMREFIDYVLESGVHGIYLLGTNGEAPLLTFKEKKKIIDIAVEKVNSRVPVIAGTMCNSTIKTIKLSKYAEEKGADAVHVIVPYYYPVREIALKEHIEEVSDKIEIPVFLYSIPQFTGYEIDTSTVSKLAEVKNLAGLKDSSGDIELFYDTLVEIRKKREDFIFFGGNDSLIFTYLSLGGDGAVTAVGNVFPKLVVDIYERYRAGDLKGAKQKQRKLLKIKNIFKNYPTMSAVKGALKVIGEDYGDLRKPLNSLNRKELNGLKKELKKINAI
ncbi:MAG: dihydrodipicolinate synthase family protein [Candidatus Thermoplasmatota archaeon]|nr:dihydrodipicolinate synthase family protein [Candidatus Thermoplasmatota archaeon]